MQVSGLVGAFVGLAEDGVDAVVALDGGTAGAGDALVAGGEGGVHEVVAAGALKQVAAGGSHVAQLRGGPREQGLGEEGVAADDEGVVGEVGVADEGSDGDAAFGCRGDLGEGEMVDVDEGSG